MTWCPHCAQNTETHRDYVTGSVCCIDCGRVVSQDTYTEDTTFVKDARGRVGNILKYQTALSESHTRTLNKGNDLIYQLIDKYGISNVDHATKYYEIAVDHGFTRGRGRGKVAAACLYVACREMEKPFMLIEFSSELGVSVYELGTVYLELCKLLNLQNHSIVQKPVDPSLFMHRYTSELMKDRNNTKVLNTALQLAVSMKRDWIQTGRKPSGICAAAIYVSSVLHGYNFTKADVVKAVHICEATLTKRLIEFENTEAGSLTIEEFTLNSMDFKKEMQTCKLSANDLKMPGMVEVVCQHKSSAVQTGFGLCKDCYLEFCGGLDGFEPPAFQRAQLSKGTEVNMKETESENIEVECVGKLEKDESDTLDDIDDYEITGYLLDAEGTRKKKFVWELINGKENTQEQAAKEDAATKKEKYKRKKELEKKSVKPPNTAAEAACQHLNKRFGSKFNLDALTRLFDDEESSLKQHRVDDGNNTNRKETVSKDINDNMMNGSMR